jgi:hypothetical protein
MMMVSWSGRSETREVKKYLKTESGHICEKPGLEVLEFEKR